MIILKEMDIFFNNADFLCFFKSNYNLENFMMLFIDLKKLETKFMEEKNEGIDNFSINIQF